MEITVFIEHSRILWREKIKDYATEDGCAVVVSHCHGLNVALTLTHRPTSQQAYLPMRLYLEIWPGGRDLWVNQVTEVEGILIQEG